MSGEQTQVARPDAKIRAMIGGDGFKAQIASILPSICPPERFARVCLTALTRTPKLAECTQASLFRCLLDLAATGLEPDGRRAHLIPYGKECTLIIDYKGLVELIRRSGEVKSLRAETVCANDKFSWIDGKISHEIDWRNPRGDVQAVYAIAELDSGESQSATMTKEEVDKIRSRSRAGQSGPWVTDWAEMAKKTAVRRLSKMLPLSSEMASALEKDDDAPAELRSGRGQAPAAELPTFDMPSAPQLPEPTENEQ